MKKIAVLLFVIVVIVAGCGNVDLPQNEAVNHQNPPDRKPLNDEPADKNVPANNTDTNEITKEEIERFFSEEDTDMDFIAQKLSEPGWYERFMYQADPVYRFEKIELMANEKTRFSVLSCVEPPFGLYFLFFRKDDNGGYKYVDSIKFYSKGQTGQYDIRRYENIIWIVGTQCVGYGTGEALYEERWYSVTDSGPRLVQTSCLYGHSSMVPGYITTYDADSTLTIDKISGKLQVRVDHVKGTELDLHLKNDGGNYLLKAQGMGQSVYTWDESSGTFITENFDDGSRQLNAAIGNALKEHF